jgi:citrate lyase subunit beta/citryl-CoA lyase
MIEKSRALTADQVMLDLEDAVAPSTREEARLQVLEELARAGWGDRVVSVRVNPPTSELGRRDLRAIADAGVAVDSIVLPKVSSPEDVRAAHGILEQRPDIGLEVLIESAAGLAAVESIALATDRLEALVFGPVDLAASLGIPYWGGSNPPEYPGDIWHYARFRLLVAARAAGVLAIDGPLTVLNDPVLLESSCQLAASVGFDGKWVIHPSQIDVANRVFTPTRADLEAALAVLSNLGLSADQGRGAIERAGMMLDEASRLVAERTVARGRAAGLG